ncbi:MAG: hypothetical protein U0326_12005 [Polyangiales bacterium]
MGEWIKRAVLLALVGAAVWRGYRYWKGGSATHQLTFRVEGPNSCHVQIRTQAGETLRNESPTLEWTSEPVEARGHAEVALTVDIPLACGWQPSQVHCFVDRDGAPWKQADTARVDDPRDGSLASYRCMIEAKASD